MEFQPLNLKHLVILATHHHVDQMHYAKSVMEQDHVSVSLIFLETLTLVVDLNVY
jgi:hypothetical protein